MAPPTVARPSAPYEHGSYQAPLPHRFQEHFILQSSATGDPLSGVRYTVKTSDGQLIQGETDDTGRTAVVWTETVMPIAVTAHVLRPKGDDPYHYSETQSSQF
jgi:uncharacterized protein (DUF2345 family)